MPMRIRPKKSLHICIIFKEGKMEKKQIIIYLPCLDFLPSKKSQYEQSENDGHVIISEKEKHKININQM